jgi:hypothetical protein
MVFFARCLGSSLRNSARMIDRLPGMKAGILRGYFDEFIAKEAGENFAEAAALKSLGVQTEEVTTPHMNLIPAIKVCTSRFAEPSAGLQQADSVQLCFRFADAGDDLRDRAARAAHRL